MNFLELLNQRSAYHNYDANEIIDERVIKELVAQAMLAPTAYHMQNIQFIAVTSHDNKRMLFEVSYQQDKILNAPVTFIVCGDSNGYLNLETALQPSLIANQITPQILTDWVTAVMQSHSVNPILRRDEALRSASLASMVLMLAAENMEYATGAMSGFEPQALAKAFKLTDNLVPVMLITVGTLTSKRYPQKKRLTVADKFRIV